MKQEKSNRATRRNSISGNIDLKRRWEIQDSRFKIVLKYFEQNIKWTMNWLKYHFKRCNKIEIAHHCVLELESEFFFSKSKLLAMAQEFCIKKLLCGRIFANVWNIHPIGVQKILSYFRQLFRNFWFAALNGYLRRVFLILEEVNFPNGTTESRIKSNDIVSRSRNVRHKQSTRNCSVFTGIVFFRNEQLGSGVNIDGTWLSVALPRME